MFWVDFWVTLYGQSLRTRSCEPKRPRAREQVTQAREQPGEWDTCLLGNLVFLNTTCAFRATCRCQNERFVNGPVRERGGHDQLKYERTVHERFTNGHVRERVVCTGKFRERTHERTNTNGSFKRSLNANMNGQH